mgnify:CR=1 FL=1
MQTKNEKSSIIKVIDSLSRKVENFYNSKLPFAVACAKDCKRKMKSITGRDYEIVVETKEEDGSIIEQSLKDWIKG